MMLRQIAIIVLGAAALIGCQSQKVSAPTTQSRALRAAVIQTLDEAMARQAGGEARTSAKDPQFALSVVDALEAQFPDVFVVTTIEEKRFQDKRFDHEDAGEHLDRLIEQANKQRLSLGTISAELVRQHQEKPLEGIRLELARRLLAAQLSAAAIGDLQSSF